MFFIQKASHYMPSTPWLSASRPLIESNTSLNIQTVPRSVAKIIDHFVDAAYRIMCSFNRWDNVLDLINDGFKNRYLIKDALIRGGMRYAVPSLGDEPTSFYIKPNRVANKSWKMWIGSSPCLPPELWFDSIAERLGSTQSLTIVVPQKSVSLWPAEERSTYSLYWYFL